MKVLIIDDEQHCHDTIISLIKSKDQNIQIVGSGYGMQDGKRLIQELHPDLVFLDIRLGDGDGIQLLRQFKTEGTLDFQVIFVTGLDQFAETAISLGALDYITKPISSDSLNQVILKFQLRQLQKINAVQMAIFQEILEKLNQEKTPPKIGISVPGGAMVCVQPEHIVRLKADGELSDVFLYEGEEVKKIKSTFGLKKFESIFRPKSFHQFYRVHNSHIVNLFHVKQLHRGGEKYQLEMDDGEIINVPIRKQRILMDRFRDLDIIH